MKALGWRWLKFNLVGALGIGVQLGSLAILRPRVHYLVATALAVELAILHNFVWHQRFTWKDRSGRPLRQLFRFHLGNGTVSIFGNLAVMWLLVGKLHMSHVLTANGIAILVCSLLNFAAGEWFVFRVPNASRPAPSTVN